MKRLVIITVVILLALVVMVACYAYQQYQQTKSLYTYSYEQYDKLVNANIEIVGLEGQSIELREDIITLETKIEWYDNQPPKIEIVTIEVIKEVPVIHEVIVEKTVEVVRPLYAKDWQSLEEFDTWLDQDDTPIYIPNGCVISAKEARDKALEIGRWLDTEAITKTEYVKYYNTPWHGDWNDTHVINKVNILDIEKCYFVDVPLGRRWFAYSTAYWE